MAASAPSYSPALSLLYPTNLTCPSLSIHELHEYRHQLDSRKGKLFTEAEHAQVDLIERSENIDGYNHCVLKNLRDVRAVVGSRAPCSTFIFWHARTSRQPLRVREEMAYEILTVLDIQPFFLDFLFLFGAKLTRQDTHFSNFRHKSTAITKPAAASGDHSAGKSTVIDLCYNLQGVERDFVSEGRPWSIRHAVAYNRLDCVTGRCTSLIVKGNEVLKQRIRSALREHQSVWTTPLEGLSECLRLHEAMALWSTENWREYFDFLAEKLDDLLHLVIEHEVPEIATPSASQEKLEHFLQETDKPSISSKFGAWLHQIRLPSLPHRSEPTSDGSSVDDDVIMAPPPPPATEYQGPRFTFADLQKTEHIEEDINSALLAIDGNVRVLAAIRAHYAAMTEPGDSLPTTGSPLAIRARVAAFLDKLTELGKDMSMHRGRCLALLKLLANRKSVLSNLLEYKNMEISRIASRQSVQSAQNTFKLSQRMSELTVRATQEAVMMRIIGLVTVVFLPGTFISTLMSTDMVRFQKHDGQLSENKVVSKGAIMLYLALTLPITAFTLVSWYVVYRWVKKERASHSPV